MPLQEDTGMVQMIAPAQLPHCAASAALIRSLDGCVYIVELDCASGRFMLADASGERAVFRSLESARAALASLPATPQRLVHQSAYDEMIGLGSGGQNLFDMPLGARGG
jgi:hypothetical protein